ncbi:hypothetical protein D3C75_787180 [compost metagenome]
MNTVVLAGDDPAGFRRKGFDDFTIDRLERKHVYHRRTDATLLQFLRRLQRFGDHNAVGDQRNIAAVTQQISLADGETIACGINACRLLTDGPHPVEALQLHQLLQNILEHGGIGHLQHHRMRQAAHDPHVFKRHMRAAVMAGADPGIGSDHLDVVALIVQRHKQLIETATAGKSGESVDKWHSSGQ